MFEGNDEGVIPFFTACARGYVEIVEAFLVSAENAKKTMPSVKDLVNWTLGKGGETSLLGTVRFASNHLKCLKIVKLIVESLENKEEREKLVKMKDKKGASAYQIAKHLGKHEVVNYLRSFYAKEEASTRTKKKSKKQRRAARQQSEDELFR